MVVVVVVWPSLAVIIIPALFLTTSISIARIVIITFTIVTTILTSIIV